MAEKSLDFAQSTVFKIVDDTKLTTPVVHGYDFSKGIDYDALFSSMTTTGAQATSFGLAIQEVNKMLSWRLSDDPIDPNDDDELAKPEIRKNIKCKIFLGYTSNMVSCGTRDTVRFLAQHKLVDVIVTTCGAIEEDLMKCMGEFHMGDFHLDGATLREASLNRIGNMLVPNSLYCKFEDFMTPILTKMLAEQKGQKINWTPSKLIARLGKEINNPSSILYWCYRNDIPVFCPAITDGAVGDNIFFFNARKPGLVLDLVEDISRINFEALHAKKTGMIICGGGVIKHHICNANLMRNGADFSVYINTGSELEASDTGASPDEAKSWGKIAPGAHPVKVWGDFTILFPLLVSQTFAKAIYAPLSEKHKREPIGIISEEKEKIMENEDTTKAKEDEKDEKKSN
ncbi:putative deoxyhypusine synthase [Monocercomonoides exilis]|uniref:putative deoxyhypusine synthase n=1 Tax=Monocercomonoides exilis TaxID=2049356 RepID=UPI003559B126|nr:putative deoxyhypusine synthase [Monocercomonoides exilis]|eukprot:MONOS_1458.1-p1 / transcript=MONOS_1458.1 / gene=MONOS_1458 / organism=Monocercomonoides_exilis_PA203 / gene_product=deoxyhypusine synthase / transcript_product=deoxyhypusine synthase / location=Mono_scaffold00026:37528-38867(-) / protein_length=399 / sequence_SO=supercontig / SO=protein_coding / is_pseudo=false